MIFSLEFLYRFLRANNYTFASTDRENLKFQKIAFDNKYSYKELSELSNSFGVNNGIVYKPWIQIGNAPHKNKFSIVSDGVRKTFNPDYECKEPDIFWFFDFNVFGKSREKAGRCCAVQHYKNTLVIVTADKASEGLL